MTKHKQLFLLAFSVEISIYFTITSDGRNGYNGNEDWAKTFLSSSCQTLLPSASAYGTLPEMLVNPSVMHSVSFQYGCTNSNKFSCTGESRFNVCPGYSWDCANTIHLVITLVKTMPPICSHPIFGRLGVLCFLLTSNMLSVAKISEADFVGFQGMK